MEDDVFMLFKQAVDSTPDAMDTVSAFESRIHLYELEKRSRKKKWMDILICACFSLTAAAAAFTIGLFINMMRPQWILTFLFEVLQRLGRSVQSHSGVLGAFMIGLPLLGLLCCIQIKRDQRQIKREGI